MEYLDWIDEALVYAALVLIGAIAADAWGRW